MKSTIENNSIEQLKKGYHALSFWKKWFFPGELAGLLSSPSSDTDAIVQCFLYKTWFWQRFIFSILTIFSKSDVITQTKSTHSDAEQMQKMDSTIAPKSVVAPIIPSSIIFVHFMTLECETGPPNDKVFFKLAKAFTSYIKTRIQVTVTASHESIQYDSKNTVFVKVVPGQASSRAPACWKPETDDFVLLEMDPLGVPGKNPETTIYVKREQSIVEDDNYVKPEQVIVEDDAFHKSCEHIVEKIKIKIQMLAAETPVLLTPQQHHQSPLDNNNSPQIKDVCSSVSGPAAVKGN